MKKKNTWMPLLLLALFIIFIYLIYNLLFSSARLKGVIREVDQVEQEMGNAIGRLEKAGQTLDSALLRIESSRQDILVFREQTDTLYQDFDQRLDSAMKRLQQIMEEVYHERKGLQYLKEELQRLE